MFLYMLKWQSGAPQLILLPSVVTYFGALSVSSLKLGEGAIPRSPNGGWGKGESCWRDGVRREEQGAHAYNGKTEEGTGSRATTSRGEGHRRRDIDGQRVPASAYRGLNTEDTLSG